MQPRRVRDDTKGARAELAHPRDAQRLSATVGGDGGGLSRRRYRHQRSPPAARLRASLAAARSPDAGNDRRRRVESGRRQDRYGAQAGGPPSMGGDRIIVSASAAFSFRCVDAITVATMRLSVSRAPCYPSASAINGFMPSKARWPAPRGQCGGGSDDPVIGIAQFAFEERNRLTELYQPALTAQSAGLGRDKKTCAKLDRRANRRCRPFHQHSRPPRVIEHCGEKAALDIATRIAETPMRIERDPHRACSGGGAQRRPAERLRA